MTIMANHTTLKARPSSYPHSLWVCPRCSASVKHMDRHRYSDGRLSKHCGCRAQKTKGMTPLQIAAHRRQKVIELKRKYRRHAGARLRTEIAAQAQAKRDVEASAKALKQTVRTLHDAHVKRYVKVLSARASSARRYAENPQAHRDRQSKRKHALVDSYVIFNLKAAGVPAAAITPSLIALKREAMEYNRLSKTIKTAIKTNWKENNETITKHP